MVLYLSQAPADEGLLSLEPEDAAHVARVLRMRPGDTVTAYDPDQLRYTCRLETVEKREVTARVIHREPGGNEPTAAVTIYAGLSKGDRFEILIQKCVECGARHIVPFISEHCVAVPAQGDYEKKLRRFQRIALEAGKQSGRSRVTTIGEIIPFAEAVRQAATADIGLFLYERENQGRFSGILKSAQPGASWAVVTGPEGGFSADEAACAAGEGLASVSLGPRILRCETAPMAALCAIMYQTGNFDIGV